LGAHGHSEDDIRYVRRRYLTVQAARSIAVQIANATFAARRQSLWGAGSTAVASDSVHVRALDRNLLTEWHSRYHGRGVLIYWHVERKSMAVHSQLISCSTSEVTAMVEGAMRHDTTMNLQANYTDSHGQSEIGFAITRLLDFDLLARIKQINKARLSRPVAGDPDAYPRLAPALTRPIRWGIVAEQYDQMIKYATAIRTRTASTERSCGASPATPPIRPTPRCSRSAACRRRSSSRATCACATCNARDRGGPERRRVLERRQRRARLRQARRHPDQP
jgi:TnpA family transposase